MAVEYLGSGSDDGTILGRSTTDKVAFYGVTPIAQKAAAAQAVIVDASGGVAAPTNGVLTITGTYNSTIIANAIATMIAQQNAMQAVLVSVGLMKGSA